MQLKAILDLLTVLRRDEMEVRNDDEAHRKGRQLLATDQVDAAAIALMTAQAHGLIC